ncbi:L-aspartate oxidase [Schleiferia thermophila]|jgi:L-aspartate oxidase|uniref:L-aspartate oxidase n=1 Tax=Schleiferia thermophila TaxID=884107 RepID=A0A369A7Q3_9FLAO|nr:FAD-binding protein [Schleiferia thermophila]PMB27820.1 L-aspartate oxidase [Fischerella thermalis CCMEE 5319]RCX05161.1 L-aspartate oxidase [Schleiferia thermophila]GCD79323.1 hypothetical protein JCM30197_05700 [Schleiferia thermophila]
MHSDIIIVGAGIAGLATAIKTAESRPDLRIAILNKGSEDNSNSYYAQGGVAAVLDPENDSFDLHISDTLQSGGYLNNPATVEALVHGITGEIARLESWGAQFLKNGNRYVLGREGGHSAHRIVHAAVPTGKEIMRVLRSKAIQMPNIQWLRGLLVTELIQEHHQCTGVKALHHPLQQTFELRAQAVVLATGGSGQAFSQTTNSPQATGDGIALAHQAGAHIRHMRFVQFHPTALYEKGSGMRFLLSEALRGAGAHLLNHTGQRFMLHEHPDAELATRDVVSSAIYRQMSTYGLDHVYLDLRPIPVTLLREQFPYIVQTLLTKGYNPAVDPIPVSPAAHYQCGGIATDLSAATSIPGLFAIGECAENGLHGRNRLASNSLAEALVFSTYLAMKLSDLSPARTYMSAVGQPIGTAPSPDYSDEVLRLKEHFRDILYKGFIAGDYYSTLQKCSALHRELLSIKHLHPDCIQTLNLMHTGLLILQDAVQYQQMQKEFRPIPGIPLQS